MEKLKKPILIVCGGFVILFIFLFIMSSCTKKKYTAEEFRDYLLELTEEYYSKNKDLLPQVDGGKTSVSISTLVPKQKKYLDKEITCNGFIEVINNNNYYMYVPNINCSNGYSTIKLSQHLTSSEKIVSTGNGLYAYNDYYIYRGDNVDNYVIFNNKLWRIISIKSDGSIKMIETEYAVNNKKSELAFKTTRRASQVWDNRYNEEKNRSTGFNDYIHQNINSRMKDYLDSVYEKDFTDKTRSYIVKQDLCIGKRSITDNINDGSIECSNILSDQYIGLLQLNEYINGSLDENCVSAQSVSCSNYNYLSTFNSTFWSMTAVRDNSYELFKIGNSISTATASSYAIPKIVILISNDVTFIKGDGTIENPYVLG